MAYIYICVCMYVCLCIVCIDGFMYGQTICTAIIRGGPCTCIHTSQLVTHCMQALSCFWLLRQGNRIANRPSQRLGKGGQHTVDNGLDCKPTFPDVLLANNTFQTLEVVLGTSHLCASYVRVGDGNMAAIWSHKYHQ